MQMVSQEYKEAMKQPVRNRGYIKAYIGVVNSEAQANAEVNDSRNSFADFSDLTKPFDGYKVERPYATCENNFSKVDGSMYFLPNNYDGFEIYNNGLVSNTLLGTFYIGFDGHIGMDIKGLTIDFGENYPTSLKVQTNAVTRTYTNAKQIFRTEDVFDNTNYIIITALAMVNGQNRLRINEFTLGIANTFSNNEVKNYTFKDFVSSISETIPSQDMTLTVDNQDLYYNVDNSESAISYMEQGQEIKVSFGYDVTGNGDIEWIKNNVCYLKTWTSTDTEAKFTAVDIFDYLLGDTYYKGLYRPSGISLYDLALDVLNDGGITDERDYWIDPYLKNVLIYNPIPVVTHAEALQIIANCGRCSLSVDRDKQIRIQSSFIPDATATDNGHTAYSNLTNLLKNTEKNGYAITSNDFSMVDGSLLFLPKNSANYKECGYYSSEVADVNGSFNTNPKITIELESGFVSYGLQINFRNVYPEEFKVTTYLEGAEVETHLYNPSDVEFITSEIFEYNDKMVIEFTKGHPNARVVIDNILLSDITDYTLTRTYDINNSPTGTRQNKIKNISVVKNIYLESSEEIKDLCSEEIVLNKGTSEYVVYLSNASYGFTVSTETSGVTVSIVDKSSYFVKLKFSGVASDNTIVKYTLKGYEYVVSEQPFTKQINSNGEDKSWNNPLVSTTELASDLEEWLETYYLGDVEYNVKWRGDPRTDANDLFYVELKDGTTPMVRAYENSLTFNGAWSSTMKARKAVLKWQ